MNFKVLPYFFFFCIFSLLHASQENRSLLEVSVCDPEFYQSHVNMAEEHLIAEECFALGRCEFSLKQYERAYHFFDLAKKKGWMDAEALDLFKSECLKEIGKQEVKRQKADGHVEVSNIEASGAERIYKESAAVVLELTFMNYVFLFASLSGLVLAVRVGWKFGRSNPGVWFFSFLLALISLYIAEWDLYWAHNLQFVGGIPFYRVGFYLWGPLFYLYLKSRCCKNTEVNLRFIYDHWLHWLPFALLFGLYVSLLAFRALWSMNWVNVLDAVLFNTWLKTVFLLVYTVLAFRLIRGSVKRSGGVHQNWNYLLLMFFALLVVSLACVSFFAQEYNAVSTGRIFYAVLFSLFSFFIGLSLFLHPELFAVKEMPGVKDDEDSGKSKYQNSGLTDALLLSLKDQLIRVVESEELYLDAELSLIELANKLNSDRYSVSQVINQAFGKNFYEFINDYRIEEAKKILEEEAGQVKIVDVAFKSGFSNRVSFNKAFKKRTGRTPSEYAESFHLAGLNT